MSHYHLEIIMPPTDDVEAAVEQIMKRFDENGDDKDEDYSSKHAFWDFWKIGGRWAGAKMEADLGEDRLAEFRQQLNDRKVTVSGVQFGKPTLQPASQREMVDALWSETFPEAPVKECPMFDHYKGNAGDVLSLGQTPKAMTCEHVIIASLNYTGSKLEAKHMVTESVWNGVNHQKTTWDQTVGGALASYEAWLKHCNPEYAAKARPNDGWISVTVDYHS